MWQSAHATTQNTWADGPPVHGKVRPQQLGGEPAYEGLEQHREAMRLDWVIRKREYRQRVALGKRLDQ